MEFIKFEDDDENLITDIGNKKFKIINSNSGIDCAVKKNDKKFTPLAIQSIWIKKRI